MTLRLQSEGIANKQLHRVRRTVMWISLAAPLFYFSDVFCKTWPPNVADQLADGDSYDFIVVGSGSAGSPVATRLAQRGQKVLLIEAGGEPPLSTRVPGLSVDNLMSDIDWQFLSEHNDRSCQSLLDARCRKPRGKVLGGSSAINLMIYVRGNKVDYDDWNIPTWTYDDMLPYFLRLESLTDYEDLSAELKEYHNNSGPVRVSLLNASMVEWRDHLVDAYQELGFKRNWDVNGPSQIGVTITHATVFAGERQGSAEAYLVPNSNNNNLNIAYKTFVTKLIIDKNNIARGVRVSIRGKQNITIKANKELILSTGTISTPQLLMLSGIGPKRELQSYGIHVYVDNAHVGQNLQDHSLTPIVLTANTGKASTISENPKNNYLDQWLADGSGPLSTIGVMDISAFVDSKFGSSVPDIQFINLYVARNDTDYLHNFSRKSLGFNDKTLNAIEILNKDSEIVIVTPIVLRLSSRGFIHLASGDPFDHPLIYGNTMVEPEDSATYLRGVRLIEKLLTTKTFLNNGVKLAKLDFLEECNDLEFLSDNYWLCFNENLGNTIFHPVGTASIGSVVDAQLKVYGVERLRVVDASVMPLSPRGNINVATVALGERGADLISEYHGF